MNCAAILFLLSGVCAIANSPVRCGAVLPRKPLVSQTLVNDPLYSYTRIKRQEAIEKPQRPENANSNVTPDDSVIKIQSFLLQAKTTCARELNMPAEEVAQKSLLYELNPTPQEKCLIECILKRTELMQQDNRLSVKRIGEFAGIVSGRNPLVVSIAMATADHCNIFINANMPPCEAAFQINKCIANEMKARKVKVFY